MSDPTAIVIPDSVPYAWPYDGRLDPARMCLLIAGTQRVHADASPAAHDVAQIISGLASTLRRRGATVCHIRHTAPTGPLPARHRPLLPQLGDEGWPPVLRPAHDDLVVSASGHDGFCGSGLDLELRSRGIDMIVAVGMAAEVAVSCTVRSANDRGFECLTLIDATAPLDAETGAHELSSVTMSGGIFGAIGSSDALLSALDRVGAPTAVAG